MPVSNHFKKKTFTKEETVKSVKPVQHVEGVTTLILTVIIRAKHYIIGWDNGWVGVTHQEQATEATIILKTIPQLNLSFIRPGINFDSRNCSLARISFHKVFFICQLNSH